MLQSIRTTATSWVIKVLFILLIASFAVWGIGDIFRGPGQQAIVAKVGDTSISVADLNTEFRTQLDRLRPVFGGQLDADKARQLGLLDRALDMLVGEALMQQEIKRLGIAVSEDSLRMRIAQVPGFRNEGGLFDPNRFRAVLRANGRSEAEFVSTLRRDMARDQLAGTLAAGIRTPTTLSDTIYRYRNEKRVADYVTLEAAKMPEPKAPDEAEQKAYLDKHKELFSTPEFRAFEMVRVDPAKLAADFKVPDERLKELYEQRIGDFKRPERRTVLQMSFADEATAKRAADELAQGKDFLAVAKEVANQDESVAKLGAVSRDELAKLLPALAGPTFDLTAGGTTPPIKTALGWNIVKVETIEPAKTDSLDEARPRLLADLARDASPDAVTRLANKFDDERAGGGSMEDAAKRAGLEAIKVAAMDREGHGPDGKLVAALPPGGVVERAVFETAANGDSPMLETSDGGAVFVRVTSVTPPALKPYAQVRDQLVQAIGSERRMTAAREAAEAMRDKIKAGATLAAAAGDGAEIKSTQPFTRDDRAAFGRPAASLVGDLFKLKPGEPTVSQTSGGYIVAQLKTVVPADPAADTAGVTQVADSLRQSIGTDVYAQFNNALRDRFGVDVKQSVIDQMFK
ncbi:MAG: SurA N-terminal domain-containing protein [Alphaproteobacteria bacterium]|nr:SurA N-terminal domain-containing protein [Alphaproteobacteria bacterium]